MSVLMPIQDDHIAEVVKLDFETDAAISISSLEEWPLAGIYRKAAHSKIFKGRNIISLSKCASCFDNDLVSL